MRKRRMPSAALIVLGIFVVVLVWLGGWYSLTWISDWVDTAQLPQYGQAGDMFGGANSLFAGLGLYAVALTLYLDRRDRRRARRPFLYLNNPEARDALLSDVRWKLAHFTLTLTIETKLESASDEIALNTTVIAALESPAGVELQIKREVVGVPVGGGKSRLVNQIFSLDGEDAKSVAGELSAGRPIRVKFCLQYESINGARWESVVSFDFTLASPGDAADLSIKLTDRSAGSADGETSAFARSDAMLLEARSVDGSWSQAPR